MVGSEMADVPATVRVSAKKGTFEVSGSEDFVREMVTDRKASVALVEIMNELARLLRVVAATEEQEEAAVDAIQRVSGALAEIEIEIKRIVNEIEAVRAREDAAADALKAAEDLFVATMAALQKIADQAAEIRSSVLTF